MDLREVPDTLVQRHPWEAARARFFARVLKKAGLTSPARSVLDVGAGDGYLAQTVLRGMAAGSEVVCVDALYTDDDLQRFATSEAANVTFARACPDRRFDLMMLLDVIEHVEDDRTFLDGLVARHLAPDGIVLISVPAWQSLFSQHDVALKHYRRYSPAEGRRLVTDCGLRVRKEGGLFHTLLAPRLAAVTREGISRKLKIKPTAGENLGQWTGGKALSAAIEGVLFADNALSHLFAGMKLGVPGLSYWALCGKS
jgi:SAM-dependent methyltransferase